MLLVGEIADELERHGMPRIESGLPYGEVEFHQRRVADIHRHRGDLRGAVAVVRHNGEARRTKVAGSGRETDRAAVGGDTRRAVGGPGDSIEDRIVFGVKQQC